MMKLILLWVIDYFRWTQLAAMFSLWGFHLLMLLSLFMLSNPEQSLSGAVTVIEWLLRLPLLGDWLAPYLTEENHEQRTAADLKSLLFWSWAVVSLLSMLLSFAFDKLFGPFKPWTLKRKLSLALLCTFVLLLAFFFAVQLNPELTANASGRQLLISGSVMFFFLLFITAYALCISHGLKYLAGMIAEVNLTQGNEPKRYGL